MRNLIENAPQAYTEFEVATPFIESAPISAGSQKIILDLLTGKSYIRVAEIGQEPQSLPQTMILSTYVLNTGIELKKVNGNMIQMNDDAGNNYTFYAEIL